MKTISRPYHWHAIYTKSRAEKKLHSLFTQQGIECYLPMKKGLRQWSDRKKWVEEPLIRSYIFVRVSEREYYDVLNNDYATRYVTFGGKAAHIPDRQITSLKTFLSDANRCVELTHEDLTHGDEVEILTGPLKGALGEVIQIRGQHRVVLRFVSLGCCIHTEIKLDEIKKLTLNQ